MIPPAAGTAWDIASQDVPLFVALLLPPTQILLLVDGLAADGNLLRLDLRDNQVGCRPYV